MLHGVVDADHDGLVLLLEGHHLDDLVHLVPQLGGRQVVAGGDGGLAGSPGGKGRGEEERGGTRGISCRFLNLLTSAHSSASPHPLQ